MPDPDENGGIDTEEPNGLTMADPEPEDLINLELEQPSKQQVPDTKPTEQPPTPLIGWEEERQKYKNEIERLRAEIELDKIREEIEPSSKVDPTPKLEKPKPKKKKTTTKKGLKRKQTSEEEDALLSHRRVLLDENHPMLAQRRWQEEHVPRRWAPPEDPYQTRRWFQDPRARIEMPPPYYGGPF